MIWTATTLPNLESDLIELRGYAPSAPEVYELEAPDNIDPTATQTLLEKYRYGFDDRSGAITIRLDSEDGAEAAMATAQALAADLDPEREWFRWEDLDDEEQAGPLVLAEIVTQIQGVGSIGPGGRIRRLALT